MVGIIGTDGKLLTASKPPKDKITRIQMNDITSGHPANSLTPRKLSWILNNAESGDVQTQMELAEDIEERDWHIAGNLQTRARAVSGLPWEVLPVDDSPEAEKVADFLTETLKRVRMRQMRSDLMDATLKGVSVLEMGWANSNDKTIPKSVTQVHSSLIDYSDGVLKVRPDASAEPVEPLPYQVIEHRHYAKAGTVMRAGLVRTLAWAFVLKHFGMQAWLIFAEVCGVPGRIGKFPAGATNEQKRELKQAVLDIGLDFAAIMPEGMQIDFMESVKNSGQAVFEPLAKYLDYGITRLILGQTLTTQGSEGGAGSYSLGQVHAMVAQDLVEDDAAELEETLQGQLVAPLVMFNYGPDVPVPEVKIKSEAPEDLEKQSRIDNTLVRTGLPMTKKYFYQRYGIPEPGPNDTLVEVPVGAPGMFSMEVPGAPDADNTGVPVADKTGLVPTKRVAIMKRMDLEKPVDDAMDGMRDSIAKRAKELEGVALDSKDVEEFIEAVKAMPRPWEAIAVQGERLFELAVMGEQKGRASVKGGEIPNRVGNDSIRMAKLQGSFDLVPSRAMDFHRLQAFYVSDVMEEAVLASAKDSIGRALDSGATWLEMREELGGILGNKTSAELSTIARNNVAQAHNGGKYHGGLENKSAFPYWIYLTVDDDRTRPAHAALHGKIYAKDDPVWQSIYPPNGHNCRCTVEEVSEGDLGREGLSVSSGLPDVPGGGVARPDLGWDNNPARFEESFSKLMKREGFVARVPQDYGVGDLKAFGKTSLWDVPVSERAQKAAALLKPEDGIGSVVDFEGVVRNVSMAEVGKILGDERIAKYFPAAVETMQAPGEVWGSMTAEGPGMWLVRTIGEVPVAVHLQAGEFAGFEVGNAARRSGVLVYKR